MATPAEIYKQYKVKGHQYKYLLALDTLGKATNEGIRQTIQDNGKQISAAETGQQMTALESKGIVRNVSSHPIRKQWELAQPELINMIKEFKDR